MYRRIRKIQAGKSLISVLFDIRKIARRNESKRKKKTKQKNEICTRLEFLWSKINLENIFGPEYYQWLFASYLMRANGRMIHQSTLYHSAKGIPFIPHDEYYTYKMHTWHTLCDTHTPRICRFVSHWTECLCFLIAVCYSYNVCAENERKMHDTRYSLR